MALKKLRLWNSSRGGRRTPASPRANRHLWFGPSAALIFLAGTFAIGLITPGYSHVRQTVSELGEMGSPGQVAFSTLLCLVATCLMVFAFAAARSLRELGDSTFPTYFVGAMAISCAGVGVFSFPNPLHNLFGMSETLGLQAPLVAALASWKDPAAKQVTRFSLIMYVIVLLAISINLIALVRPAELWMIMKPYFGIVQRSLFIAWFGWCAGYALLLMRIGGAGPPNDP